MQAAGQRLSVSLHDLVACSGPPLSIVEVQPPDHIPYLSRTCSKHLYILPAGVLPTSLLAPGKDPATNIQRPSYTVPVSFLLPCSPSTPHSSGRIYYRYTLLQDKQSRSWSTNSTPKHQARTCIHTFGHAPPKCHPAHDATDTPNMAAMSSKRLQKELVKVPPSTHPQRNPNNPLTLPLPSNRSKAPSHPA